MTKIAPGKNIFEYAIFELKFELVEMHLTYLARDKRLKSGFITWKLR